MCIISGPVVSVNSTKIFAMPSKDGKRQITVYSNKVKTLENNAMLLPVPNPKSVKFEKVPADLFSQCKKSFEQSLDFALKGRGGFISNNSLKIQSHGSYEVVIVPSIDDFHRVPKSFAEVTPEVIAFLKNYNTDFGFLLCRLRAGSVDYEPFAYSHDLYNSKLFFPTKHFHLNDDRNIIKSKNPSSRSGFFDKIGVFDDSDDDIFSSYASFNSGSNFKVAKSHRDTSYSFDSDDDSDHGRMEIADDWDHEIYSCLTSSRYHNAENKNLIDKNYIDWSTFSDNFKFDNRLSLRCLEITNKYKNIDIQMPIFV
jgi:hypothetical protein